MQTCCPNCSAGALGADAGFVCTECATAGVAGASFSLPMVIAGAFAAGIAVIVFRMLRRRTGVWIQAKRPAQA